ncbi:MAG: MBL fold metallo-hydrolase [Pseudomonadota bacterium]
MLTIKCLGTGKGATNFLTGRPSTAYVLCRDGAPVLLMDCGAGVGRSLMAEVGDDLPRHIYISHNHSDHTGDLPVYMANQHAQTGIPIELYGHADVLSFVAKHRLHELDHAGHPAAQSALWHAADAENCLVAAGLRLRLFKTEHSYLCYGFVAQDARTGAPVLGWSADCRYDLAIYDRITQAPVVILHARAEQSQEHASFDEVDAHAQHHPDTAFYVAHHDISDHVFRAPNVTFLQAGMDITLIP